VVALAMLALAGITGCAGSASDVSQNDPAEPVNRAIFDANHAVDRHLMRPVAEAYQDWMPQGVRTGVYNFSANLKQPATVATICCKAMRAMPGPRRTVCHHTTIGGGVSSMSRLTGLARTPPISAKHWRSGGR